MPLTIGRLVKPPTKEQPGKTSCKRYASLAVDLLSPRAFEPSTCQFSHRYPKERKKKKKTTTTQAVALSNRSSSHHAVELPNSPSSHCAVEPSRHHAMSQAIEPLSRPAVQPSNSQLSHQQRSCLYGCWGAAEPSTVEPLFCL